MDPMRAFRGEDDGADLAVLISSGGVSIWKEGDPVHLTDTAYGDNADFLIDMVSGRAVEETATPTRKSLESMVTRSAADPVQRPVAGWLVGGNQGGCKGARLHARPRGSLEADENKKLIFNVQSQYYLILCIVKP